MSDQKPAFSRRDFLERIGYAGGAAAVYSAMTTLGMIAAPGCTPKPELAPGSGKGKNVVVLGGGIAGLVAAYELRKGGYQVRVLEARSRPGGRVFTLRGGSVVDEVDSQQKVTWEAHHDLYFDAGAARLPAHHQGILGYARELGVPIEVLSNENRNALLHNSQAFDGKPQLSRRVRADQRGFVAELAAKAIDQASLGRPLTTEDQEKLKRFLREFGGLDESLIYRGSARNGYRQLPGGGDAKGQPLEPLDVQQLLSAGFWSQLTEAAEGPTQAPTMVRPVGGMSKIAEAIAKSLGKIVKYDAEVARLRRRDQGARVEWRDKKTGKLSAIDADVVVVTIQPGLLGALDQDFSPAFRQALAAPAGSPLAKVGFLAKRRFWELDSQIYGGISWTDHTITQLWYPSQGLLTKQGVLVGAYVFRDGEQFAALSPAQRIELAIQGGETLHPGYRNEVEQGVSISWRKVKYSSGATTHWTDETRKSAYPVLLEPDGPYFFAGEYLSYITGWQEGAVQSAHHTLGKLAAALGNRANAERNKS